MTAGCDFLDRLIARDASLWPAGNVSATRLGWLDAPTRLLPGAKSAADWADGVDARRVLLIGMGGSSLGPLVLSRWGSGRSVEVLDTTDPQTIATATEDLDSTFIVVSSKSGSTIEVRTLFAHCWERLDDPGRYAVVTDEGSPLQEQAAALGVKQVFTNDPNIGGRYSALSLFGLVPAALAGVPIDELLHGAIDVDMAEAADFGLSLADAASEGRDKLTISAPHEFGLWAEQLVAESTGKDSMGIVPVPIGDEAESGEDRNPVTVTIDSVSDLGREFLRWMVTTAAAGSALGIDPFDEPDVAAAKAATGDALASLPLPPEDPLPADELVGWLSANTRPGDYVSLQGYLPFGHEVALENLRRRCRDVLGGMAVTAGYGPRFLHSTGQLHKGGPNSVVAVQILPESRETSVAIPGETFDFGTLIEAQALGDLRTLRTRGRRAMRVVCSDLDTLVPA